MANIISSFLVSIGFDTSELQRGEREISRSMDGVKSLVATTGAALGAAFIGVGKTAMDTANRVNELRLNTNLLYTSTQYVSDYGNALRSMGGDASDAVGEISRIETALSNLRQKGDASAFTELSYFGVDTKPLMAAESGGQFIDELSKQFPKLSNQQQSGVASTLGLSPAAIELLRKGNDGYRDIMSHVHDIAGVSDELLEKSAAYNKALAEAGTRWEGIANTISEAVLPGMTDIVNKGADILTDVVKPMVERDPVTTGAGLSMLGAGVAGSVAAPLLGAAGLGGIGALAGAVAPPVAIAGAGTLAYNMNQQDVKNLTGQELPAWLFEKHTVFDESEGDAAGGLLHKGSFLDKAWNMDQKGLEDLTGWKAPEWLFKPIGGGDNEASPRSASDSLNQDYDVQKMTYMNSGSYAPEAMGNTYSAAEATGNAVAEKLYKVPLKATVNNNVDLTVELDGRVLDSKITEVQQRNNQMTVDDMQSTTAR